MKLFTKKKEITLTDAEWEILDVVMLILRYVGNESENLKKILKPIAMDLFEIYEELGQKPPDGTVKKMPANEFPALDNLTKLTRGRI